MAATSPMSPMSLSPSPIAASPDALVGFERILSGYRHHDFPDLSSRRFPPESLWSISQPLGLIVGKGKSISFSTIAAAVARVLGAYCACQDVLLGVSEGGEEKVLPVRVAWGDGHTWAHIATGIAEALANPLWPRTHPNLLRRALDLPTKQFPALALLSAGPLLHPDLGGHFPLVIVLDQCRATVSVTASERTSHPSQSKLFLSQVVALAQHATAIPESSFVLLPSLSSDLVAAYEKQSLKERIKTYDLVPPAAFAMDYLTARATEQPDGVAVRWYSDLSTDIPISSYIPETITNAELEKKANQLGRWLLQIGLQQRRSVAICMKRDIWFHIALIGVLRAGGCYVPIDAELPTERQQFIAKDSEAQFILTTSDLPCFSSLGHSAIDVNDSAVMKAIEEQNADALLEPGLDDISYILYTSGTTGAPKGCILTHRGLSEAIWALSQFCAAAELSPVSRVNYLSIASVAFDVHIAEVMVALAVGIPILSAPRSLLLEDLPYYIKHLRVSHVGIVPSLIEATMGAVQEDEDSGSGTTLRYIASGGEKISDAILDKWTSHPKVRLANFYGPSEVTIGCAARMMDKDTPRANIGRTFANVSAYVVDENVNVVLRGSPGELVVEGPLVGRGYVGRSDLTQKVFLNFPDDGTDRRAYRTGDLVRMMSDGTLEIVGRIDTQIKLRGVRIESEGISSILRNAASPEHVLDVMTILTKHSAIGVDQLVSFISWDTSVPIATRKGGNPSLTTPPAGLLHRLRSTCDCELASYMRPSHIIPLNFIPLSNNGKADAKVLAAVFLALDLGALTGLMADGQAPAPPGDAHRELTSVERRVAEVLRPYIKLPLERLGPQTNLFECGMDSLSVARLATDLRRVFGIATSPANIMQSPVLKGIASLMGSNCVESASQTASLIIDEFVAAVQDEVTSAYLPDSVAALLPPFPVQEGVLYRSANSSTMYVQHVLMRLGPGVSVSALMEAWKDLVAQHEMLRTVFHVGTDLVQVVLRPESHAPSIPEKGIVECDDIGFKDYFTSNEASNTARELNLNISRQPPWRLSVFVAAASRHMYAALSIHHALFDGISLPVLLRGLERACTHQPQLPSATLREALEKVTIVDEQAARTFWTSYLKDSPWHRMLNRTASLSVSDIASFAFRRPLSELQSKAAGKQVTLQALLMCAYGSLLAQHVYAHDDVVFGVIRAGRSIPLDNIDATICPMITVVPARVRLNDPPRVLQTVQQDIARVSEYEHVSLGRIQKWVAEGGGALFDTLFSVSFKTEVTSELWDVLESQNPEPDYILAVEVVLDLEQDKAFVQAAFTPLDISSAVVNDILSQLEDMAIRIAESSDWGLTFSPSEALDRQPTEVALANGAPSVTEIDQDLVSRITAIASQFLRVDSKVVTADTSLLSLGLDSIKSVGLSRKLSLAGLGLSSADIMRLSTPLRLAIHVQQSPSSQEEVDDPFESTFETERKKLGELLDMDAVKLTADDDVKIFPTSILQAGMLSQTISSGGRLYVHLFPLCLATDIDIARLRDAWSAAIASFDILRTSFHFLPGPGVWVQAVHSNPPVRWSESQYDSNVNLVESLNPFLKISDENDAFRYPPIFAHILKAVAPGDAHRLVIVLHHALYDGLSIAKLFHAVDLSYRGFEPVVPSQYHRLLPRLLWQENNGTSFWVNGLRDLRNAPIPRKSTAETEPAGAHLVSLLVNLAAEEIRQACRDVEVTPQCIGQTAFAKLLSVMTHHKDVVFGRVVSGRDLPDAEDVIGPMLNTVPCRVLFSEHMSNRELLKRVHDANIAGMPWQHASLRSIQRELQVSNLWDSIFVFQPGQEQPEFVVDSPWVFDVGDEEDVSIQYPLNVELHETVEGFVVKAACMSDVATAAELRHIIERYAAMLCDLVRSPNDLWFTGLPEILLDTSPRDNDTIVEATQETDHREWDAHLGPFREILSTTTRVPSYSIMTSTYLAALGVDSITAVQIAAKARRANLRITAADIVQSKTIGDLLEKIKYSKAPATNGVVKTNSIVIELPRIRWSAIVPSHVVDQVERIVPTSAGMEWMIGVWQRSRGSRFQHVFGYRLPAEVEPSKLRDAWAKLVHRHAVLRATFAYDIEAGVPRTVVFKPEALGSTWVEETLNSSENELAVVQEKMKTLVSNPTPIDRPMTRAVFLHSPQAAYLLINLHHFQYDAWSLPLLVDDLLRIYTNADPKSSNALDNFLCLASKTETEQAQKKYWTDAFRDLKTPALFPTNRNGLMKRGRQVYTDYEAIAGAAALDRRARDLAVPLQSIFLACWAQVQAKHSQTNDPIFSLWHSGRTGDLEDLGRLAVPCINVLPFRVADGHTGDTRALAKRIQKDLQARSAVVEQSRLVKVHEWIGLSDRPLTNVFINIVKTAPDLEGTIDALFEPLNVPYHIPEVPPEGDTGCGKMGVTDFIQDDIMVDIVIDQGADKIITSVEFADTVLDMNGAKLLLEEWGALVKDALDRQH